MLPLGLFVQLASRASLPASLQLHVPQITLLVPPGSLQIFCGGPSRHWQGLSLYFFAFFWWCVEERGDPVMECVAQLED